MASFRSRLEQHLEHQIYAFYDEEDPATIPQSTFARVMAIDSRKISDSTISFYNISLAESIEYQIQGSLKHVDVDNSPFGQSDPETDAPAVADESWQNILLLAPVGSADVLDPADNDQTLSKFIPARTAALGWTYESFNNKWAWVQILARSTGSGVTAKIHHRGTNQS